jgi:hypothetical protein
MKTQTKVVRVISSQGAKVRVSVPAVQAPRPVAAALSCCCKSD